MKELLNLENVCFSYKGTEDGYSEENFSVKNLSFKIYEGDFISIIGKNGSGKSTVVKLFSKILEGYSGKIFFRGNEISSADRKEFSRSLSYLPQSAGILNEDLTVREFLHLGRYSHKKFTDFNYSVEDNEIVSHCINETGTEKIADKNFYRLSGGEKQKVLLTLGLIQLDIQNELSGKILIIDEPLTYLDVNYQLEIFSVLGKLNKRGLTIVIVIHDLSLALNFTDKSLLISEGKLVKYSESEKVITEDTIKEHFLIDSKIVSYDSNYLINYSIQNKI
ncbi:MAG: ABC transporter ATP-binding protein [Ignavibacteria bacterium]|nr:ABC transporter ATP-binding protein [Ignavibacteria bacterium]